MLNHQPNVVIDENGAASAASSDIETGNWGKCGRAGAAKNRAARYGYVASETGNPRLMASSERLMRV